MIWVFRIFCPFFPKKAQGNQRLLQSADSLNIYFIISHACFLVNVFGRIPHIPPVPQQNLTNATSILSLLLMFIGGSPVGTAGGIKTVTLAVLVVSALATIQNKRDVSLFDRNISKQTVNKAVAVTMMSFAIMFTSTLLLSAVSDASALDVAYETVSATATVGLSRNLTPYLNTAGKAIIIVTMYLGRVGPISLAMALNSGKKKNNILKNPTEEISVG